MDGMQKTMDPASRAAGIRLAACGLVVAAGSAGPWVTLMTDNGRTYTPASGAGARAVGAASFVAAASLARNPASRVAAVAAVAAFLAALGLGAAHWRGALGDLGGYVWLHRVGWGLLAVVVGGAAGAVLAVAQAAERRWSN